ncbi:MAG: hypothetical protein ACK4IA_16530 [Paracoccus hibiscisoli]|uniref:hypothetical protein n=1 Tax=Paracoccus hibiscisoli TaxID=2023261 RepID=UPI00391922DD
MATIKNLSREAVSLPTGHTIAREGELTTTNDVLRSADNVRTLGALVAAKVLRVEYDRDPPTVEAVTSVIDAPDRKPSPQIPLSPTERAAAPAET